MITRDEHGIVADWLVKILLGIAIFGVIAYDAGSIAVNYFSLDSSADEVAVAVSLSVASGPARNYTPDEIYRLAQAQVEAEDGGVADARVLREGTGISPEGIVHVRLTRVADTLIVKRIGPAKKWARATVDGQAGTR